MSKLEELIQELCPDGVEYKALGEVCTRHKGTAITATKMKELDKPNAPIKVFAGGNTIAYVNYGDIPDKDIINEVSIIVKSRGNIGFEYYEQPFSHKNEMWSYSVKISDTSLKYLYYYLQNNILYFQQKAKSGKLPQISIGDTEKYLIPVPPLAVQDEIVRILDNFTEATTELVTLLEEEVIARKKQYEYYRENLIHQSTFKQVELSDIGTFVRGKRFVRTDIVDKGVYCMHYGDIYTKYGLSTTETDTFLTDEKALNMRFASKNDIIIVQAGENEYDLGVGVVWESDSKVAIHDACYIYTTDQNPRYIAYYLRTHKYHQQLLKYVSSGKISSVNAKGIGKSIIPLPSMEEQQRIVDILDKFDTLVNDLTTGIPAEIKARQQQYEYYRDKLLNFKEVQ
ncbi:MAG: hypothetical protein ATN35_06705 [Epulopiscium sp. Nele67-Bin004]|nr:MAG: hypothetical protein ATN35_06705 [Epulopiscium sp. Nele67-Bin004]